MRFDGRIRTWDDERGFGFIEPVLGGEDIFVHIKAMSNFDGRPQIAQQVSFEVELGPTGKKRARNVNAFRPAPPRRPGARATSGEVGKADMLAIPLLVLIYLTLAVLWNPPPGARLIYLAASPLTFLIYAFDKAAAKRGDSRTPERTLHLLALVGGWPGALLAQQLLRHKCSKPSFRKVFWATVLLNTGALIVMSSPQALPIIRAMTA